MKGKMILFEDVNNVLNNLNVNDTVIVDYKDSTNSKKTFSFVVKNIDNDFIYYGKNGDNRIDIDALKQNTLRLIRQNKPVVEYDLIDINFSNRVNLNVIDQFMQSIGEKNPFTIEYKENNTSNEVANFVIDNNQIYTFTNNNTATNYAQYGNGIFTIPTSGGNQLNINDKDNPIINIKANKSIKYPISNQQNNSKNNSTLLDDFLNDFEKLNFLDILKLEYDDNGNDAYLELLVLEEIIDDKIKFNVINITNGFPLYNQLNSFKGEFIMDKTLIAINNDDNLMFKVSLDGQIVILNDIINYDIDKQQELSKKELVDIIKDSRPLRNILLKKPSFVGELLGKENLGIIPLMQLMNKKQDSMGYFKVGLKYRFDILNIRFNDSGVTQTDAIINPIKDLVGKADLNNRLSYNIIQSQGIKQKFTIKKVISSENKTYECETNYEGKLSYRGIATIKITEENV